jgi:hypothetical protein
VIRFLLSCRAWVFVVVVVSCRERELSSVSEPVSTPRDRASEGCTPALSGGRGVGAEPSVRSWSGGGVGEGGMGIGGEVFAGARRRPWSLVSSAVLQSTPESGKAGAVSCGVGQASSLLSRLPPSSHRRADLPCAWSLSNLVTSRIKTLRRDNHKLTLAFTAHPTR